MKENMGVGFSKSAFLTIIAVCAFGLVVSCVPLKTFASTVASVQTYQVIPPGQNTCAALQVSDVTPYIYNGTLESFDVTISDNSYVGILASVGKTSVPLGFITRWASATGGVRIHVDTPTTPVRQGVPVSLTLVSAAQGAPVCVSTVSFTAQEASVAPVTVLPNQNPQPVAKPMTQTANTQAPTSSPVAMNAMGSESGASTTFFVASSSSTNPSVINTLSSKLPGSCRGLDAYRLWFILLAIYLVIVVIVVFAEFSFLYSSLGSASSILVPLVLLLAFWYFSPSCRAAAWIPVLACIIGVIGLFLSFREDETMPTSRF